MLEITKKGFILIEYPPSVSLVSVCVNWFKDVGTGHFVGFDSFRNKMFNQRIGGRVALF